LHVLYFYPKTVKFLFVTLFSKIETTEMFWAIKIIYFVLSTITIKLMLSKQ